MTNMSFPLPALLVADIDLSEVVVFLLRPSELLT